jgi:hypothetical protein
MFCVGELLSKLIELRVRHSSFNPLARRSHRAKPAFHRKKFWLTLLSQHAE